MLLTKAVGLHWRLLLDECSDPDEYQGMKKSDLLDAEKTWTEVEKSHETENVGGPAVLLSWELASEGFELHRGYFLDQ